MEKYTLIITEKPSAAQRIAYALDQEGKPEKVEDKNVSYFLVKRDKPLIVVSALGHLYTVAHVGKGRNYYPVFHFKWVPRYLVEKNAKQVRLWIEVISKLAQNAEEFIDACDYDIEGSLIGYCLFRYACVNKQDIAKRMKFSTLTKKALEESYSK
nr:DNA topoisomerase I [Candidatus Bathyarchaeota archaeon]NIV44332.1 DNA topoisomerase I [Candidatus Bathyarchaeota archaeon]